MLHHIRTHILSTWSRPNLTASRTQRFSSLGPLQHSLLPVRKWGPQAYHPKKPDSTNNPNGPLKGSFPRGLQRGAALPTHDFSPVRPVLGLLAYKPVR